ncbi:MAG: NADAR family protein [Polyangiaceae bacterium]|nr:NADAR family protein [Polyangiaceae bacterium]
MSERSKNATGELVIAEPLSVAELDAREELPDFLFFWGHAAKGPRLGSECLSQWYPASFIVNGICFHTAEHYMMWSKARLFDDEVVAEQITGTREPARAKALGRSVRNFDQQTWEDERFGIVVEGSTAKFSQNTELGAFLLGTKNKVLVEASPRDTIWGIGLGAANPNARIPARWRGLNLLGFALMKARAVLRKGG